MTYNTLKSRTFWTVVATLVVNTIPQVRSLIPAQWIPVVDLLLAILTVYFHVSPSQNYPQPK